MEFDYELRRCSKDEYRALGGKPGKYDPSSTLYYVAIQGDRIMGSVSFALNFQVGWESHYFILNLSSKIERKGVGSRLVHAVESDALESEVPLVVLRFRHPQFWKKRGYHVDEEYGYARKRLEI